MVDELHDVFRMATENLSKEFTAMTLKQMKGMNLSSYIEILYFGRTSDKIKNLE